MKKLILAILVLVLVAVGWSQSKIIMKRHTYMTLMKMADSGQQFEVNGEVVGFSCYYSPQDRATLCWIMTKVAE